MGPHISRLPVAQLKILAADRRLRRRRAAIEEADRLRAASERLRPDLDVAIRLHSAALTAERILIDGDDLAVGENTQNLRLDYQSSLVNFEAVQHAPSLTAGDTLGLRGANIVLLPTPTPRGVFRPGAGPGFQQ